MKKLILSVMLVAFAVAVQAGEGQACSKEKAACCPKEKAQAKAECGAAKAACGAKEAKGCPIGASKEAKKLSSPKATETAKR